VGTAAREEGSVVRWFGNPAGLTVGSDGSGAA
jgi:hypothetical protein